VAGATARWLRNSRLARPFLRLCEKHCQTACEHFAERWEKLEIFRLSLENMENTDDIRGNIRSISSTQSLNSSSLAAMT
jgi:hypothetical protein